ncbi:hypothetical protein V8F20_005060 [Naviculisporaceae sp. PSN 640]
MNLAFEIWEIIILFLLHIRLCRGDNDGEYFIRPPPSGTDKDYRWNELYYVGDTMFMQWNTYLEGVKIDIYQDSLPGDFDSFYPHITLVSDLSGDVYEWEVSYYNMDLSRNNVFYLSLTAERSVSFNAHYFNISERPVSASTEQSPTSTSTSTLLYSDIEPSSQDISSQSLTSSKTYPTSASPENPDDGVGMQDGPTNDPTQSGSGQGSSTGSESQPNSTPPSSDLTVGGIVGIAAGICTILALFVAIYMCCCRESGSD